MREVIELSAAEALPSAEAVRRGLGLPESPRLSAPVREQLERALELCAELAEPRGVFDEIPRQEFEAVYYGEGRNAEATPLEQILPRAEALALFAATLGESVSARIAALFAAGELSLAYLLDAVASEAADRLATLLGERFLAGLRRAGRAHERTRVLPYSPGYCGWDVSGQGKLFARLRPVETGITLNESFLMQPLKSVSGVLAAGPGRIHRFRADFPFCAACARRECRERIASVLRD